LPRKAIWRKEEEKRRKSRLFLTELGVGMNLVCAFIPSMHYGLSMEFKEIKNYKK